jgi:hypothetical protein
MSRDNDAERAEHQRQWDEAARRNSEAWRARQQQEAASREQIYARLLDAVERKS